MAEVDYQLAILLQHKYEQEDKDLQLAKTLQEQEAYETKQRAESTKNISTDSLLARSLQDQFQKELAVERPGQNLVYDSKRTSNPNKGSKCLTDPSWEVIDPTPDIHNLFIVFNERFFWNKLGSVCVCWSKRMTTCAGICSYQGRGGMCTISLSEPLLKLRPRKDLVETLLHEMIHAYLFVTHNNRDRDGHGPEFHKHMKRINEEAGTHITVYHDFHDEVHLYQQHWWKCNGPCQHWKPYFGMVRRAMNRAPGPNDRWWADHSQRCGGQFIKVKEPEKPSTSKSKSTSDTKTPDIRSFFPGQHSNNTSGTTIKTISNTNTNSTVHKVIPNSNNIHGFTNLGSNSNKTVRGGTALKNNSSTIVVNKKPSTITKDDSSNQLINGKNRTKSEPGRFATTNIPDYSVVRNYWTNKFPNTNKSSQSHPASSTSAEKEAYFSKLLDPTTAIISSPDSLKRDNPRKRVNLVYPNSSNKSPKLSNPLVECPICAKKFAESDINAHLDECFTTSKDSCGSPFLSNNSDDHLNNSKEGSLKDDVFEIFDDSDTPPDEPIAKECDVCQKMVPTSTYSVHLNKCLHGMLDDIENKYFVNIDKDEDVEDVEDLTNQSSNEVECLACNKKILKSELNEHLEDCMNLSSIFDDANEPIEEEIKKATIFNCPVCMKMVGEVEMNDHIDVCLGIVNDVSN